MTDMIDRVLFNHHAETALKHPCYFAVETIHPRFRTALSDNRTMVMTVNSGYE
jgi:hypothetical protein